MKARINQDAGIYGIPMFCAGQIIEVEHFIGPYGDPQPDLFIDRDGSVWPSGLLTILVSA